MTRRITAPAALLALLMGLGFTATAATPDAQESPEVGFVLYTKSTSPGTLNARWMYGEHYRGPGIAIGGPRVRYFYEDGEFSDEYDLVIEDTGDIYKVTWLVDGQVRALGVGMEVENGLAVGWQRVTN